MKGGPNLLVVLVVAGVGVQNVALTLVVEVEDIKAELSNNLRRRNLSILLVITVTPFSVSPVEVTGICFPTVQTAGKI